MNNEPDYKDNLAFEPEMTMQDVFKSAVEKYNYDRLSNCINKFIDKYNLDVTIFESGDIWLGGQININTKPKQVLMIIEGLM